MNVLNLDELATITRTITLGGVAHPVEDLTVEGFIATSKEAKELESNEGRTLSDMVIATIRIIRRSVPTLSEEALNKLTLEKLTLVSKFLRGELEKDVVASETTAPGEAKN